MATCDDELAQAAVGQLSASSRAAANQQPEEPDAITAPQAKATYVAKAKPKAKANPVPQDALVSSVFGRLYMTRGRDKSYIQYKTDDGKLNLLTGLNEASCPKHQTAVADLAAWVAKNPKASLAQVIRKRDSFQE